MSNNYETPETNVKLAALKLMRHKMLIEMGKDRAFPSLGIDDVNEILVVAGLPVIMPDELKAPEVDVIKVDKSDSEEANDDTL